MKKKLLLALSLVGVAALSIGGTMAFYTDAKEDVNTFTTENVDITLNSPLKDSNLVIMPNNVDKTEVNYTITNNKAAAYVWLSLKVPRALEPEIGAPENNIVHWNLKGRYWYGHHENEKFWAEDQTEAVPTEDTWIVPDEPQRTWTDENGIAYYVYDILYYGALEKGETTNLGLSTIYLDERVDMVDGKWVIVKNSVPELINYDLSKGVGIIVEAHGIQKDGFDTVKEAYAKYMNQWKNTESTTKIGVSIE